MQTSKLSGCKESTQFCERPFMDITDSYSDRLGNIAMLRRGKPIIQERKPVLIIPEINVTSQPTEKKKRKCNFNRGIDAANSLVPRVKKQFKTIDYALAFAICLDIHHKVDLYTVSKRHGIGYSTVKRINNQGTKLAIRCFAEIENGAKRPTV